MTLMSEKNIVTVALISFMIGCSVQVGEDGGVQPILKPTPSNSSPVNIDQSKKHLKDDAKLSMDLSKDWRKSQRRLGSDDWIDVCFVNSNVGWIVSIKGDRIVPLGGSIFKTKDGGRTWTRIPLDVANHSYISNVSFIDESRGWLVVQTLGRSATRMQVFETSDGGETWTPGFSLDDAIAGKIAFNSQGTGWVIGIKAKAVYMHDQKNLVLYTRDFGKSWSDVTPKLATDDKGSGPRTVLFEDVFTDILLEDDSSQLTSISRDGKVSLTRDQGSTWKFLMELDVKEPNSQGFSKITKLNDGGFLAVSGADGPHGTWSSVITAYDDSIRTRSLLGRIVITDMQVHTSGDLIASGLQEKDLSENDEVVSAVIIGTKDFSDWKVLYETSGRCKLGCKFNKMARRGDGYYFVGTDGLLLAMDRNLKLKTTK